MLKLKDPKVSSSITELRITYKLHKVSRSSESISFTVEQQKLQQLLILFENTIDQTRLRTARLRLQELDIRDPQPVEQILGDA